MLFSWFSYILLLAVPIHADDADVAPADTIPLRSAAAVSLGRIGAEGFDFSDWKPGDPQSDRRYLLLISSSQQRLSQFPLEQVQQSLTSKDAEVRRLAALALLNGDAFDERTTSLLIELANRDRSAVQRAAILALGERSAGSKTAAQNLAELALHSDVKNLRLEAIKALAKSKADLDSKSPTLLAAALDEDSRIATGAIAALIASLPGSESAVLQFLDQAGADSKRLMLDQLVTAHRITDQVTERVITESFGKDVPLRRLTAEVLGTINKKDPTITNRLEQLLNDQDFLVQTYALRSIVRRRSYSSVQTREFLESIDPDHPLFANEYFFPADRAVEQRPAAIPPNPQLRILVDQVAAQNASVRRNAKRKLAELAGQDENRRVIESLLAELLTTTDQFAKLHSLSLLMTFDQVEPITGKRVLELFTSHDELVSRHAGQVLIKLGRPSVQPLVDIAADRAEDLQSRIRAIETLGYLGVQAKSSVPALTTIFFANETSL